MEAVGGETSGSREKQVSLIPPDSPWRGCASNFPPAEEDVELAAQVLVETTYYYNCREAPAPYTPLDEVVYRGSGESHDILHHVFRWNGRNYDQVFRSGFQARPQDGTPDNVYYNLEHHVNHGVDPLHPTPGIPHVFVSTSLSNDFGPEVEDEDAVNISYRYEIFAPGGIWVKQTLLDRYSYPYEDEAAFVAGVAPEYIRSAQCFRRSEGRWEPVDTRLMINRNFNPDPSTRLPIRNPVSYHIINGVPVDLTPVVYPPLPERETRQVSTDSDPSDWYAAAVVNIETYINAAFRSSRANEAYLFMNNEYVLIEYAPGTTGGRVVNGPLLISDGYPSLCRTSFAEYGIDCAFGSQDVNQAFIFSGKLCAQISYAPGTTDDWVIRGRTTISKMFPFFKGTVFENGVDAAFESTTGYEAYLFKENHYALINYSANNSHLIGTIRLISEGFPSLRGTIFENGIDAAFASHGCNEAYIFKGDSYALINFAPGTTDGSIIGGVKPILPNWPFLRGVLPRKNRGLDTHADIAAADPNRDHGEL